MAAEWTLAIAWELALFAGAIGFWFALDDLAVDALWLGGIGRRPKPLADFHKDSGPAPRLTYAVLIPAWQEAAVIGQMLSTLRERWHGRDYRVYVGGYPNDAATLVALARIAATADWLQLVVLDRSGPTTKGDCLNAIWRRLRADRQEGRFKPDAVIVHDAEDVVATHELAAHDAALVGADYVQLPVLPLIDPAGRAWSSHYLDEFAEAHGKELPVREAICAMMPTAGVGFAVRIAALDRLADADGPFAGGSLTEDYELGIRLARNGARGRMMLATDPSGRLVATRAYFPNNFADSVRQKARWLHGIALGGWDRLGWDVPPRADPLDALMVRWMLWRDRRTLLCAAAVLAGYLALGLTLVTAVLAPDAVQRVAEDYWVRMLATVMTLALLWRLVMRAILTARFHGWQQGLLSVPRQFLSNMVMVACGWRALLSYARSLNGEPAIWAKTAHRFPVRVDLST
jgi:adsorption protein B